MASRFGNLFARKAFQFRKLLIKKALPKKG
jgi:hypothetical protein